jgi:hypothetical protein
MAKSHHGFFKDEREGNSREFSGELSVSFSPVGLFRWE